MPDPYIVIGIVLGGITLYLGRRWVIRERNDDNMDEALVITIGTICMTASMIVGWPLFVGILLLAWLFGWVTIPSVKAAIRKHLKE